jgi:hypothetical protein
MPTVRNPYRRQASTLSPRAVALFDQYRRAQTDEQETKLHSDLIDALGYPTVPPWQWPAVVKPDDPEDPQTPAERLWVQLAQASREARRAALQAKRAAVTPPPSPPESPPESPPA